MKKRKLTPKQELFCLEYVVDFNATQAAIRAGYSKRSAESIGLENLGKPMIAERIKELRKPIEQKPKDMRQRIIDELAAIAFSNASDFYEEIPILDDEGEPTGKTYRQMKADVLDSPNIAAIQSFEPGAYGAKPKMADKQKALDMLARHLGLYNADTSQKPENTNVVDLSGISSEKLRELQKVWNEKGDE